MADRNPCPWCWLAAKARTLAEAWNALDLGGRRSVSLMVGLVALVAWAGWPRG